MSLWPDSIALGCVVWRYSTLSSSSSFSINCTLWNMTDSEGRDSEECKCWPGWWCPAVKWYGGWLRNWVWCWLLHWILTVGLMRQIIQVFLFDWSGSRRRGEGPCFHLHWGELTFDWYLINTIFQPDAAWHCNRVELHKTLRGLTGNNLVSEIDTCIYTNTKRKKETQKNKNKSNQNDCCESDRT